MDILCILRNISKKLLLFVSSFVTVVWTQHTDSCLFVCLVVMSSSVVKFIVSLSMPNESIVSKTVGLVMKSFKTSSPFLHGWTFPICVMYL